MTTKQLIATLTICLLTYRSTCQVRTDENIRLETGCGFVGEVSTEVYKVHTLVIDNKINELISLTLSNNQKLKLLSIIALDNMGSTNNEIVQTLEGEDIKKYKKKKDPFYICSDCSGHEKTTIRKLFSKDKDSFRKGLDFALKSGR